MIEVIIAVFLGAFITGIGVIGYIRVTKDFNGCSKGEK